MRQQRPPEWGFTARVRAYNVRNTYTAMSDNLDDCFISDDDELASVQASVRAVRDLLEKYDLEDEFEALHLHYLPEELQKRREWLKELRAKHGGKSSYQG